MLSKDLMEILRCPKCRGVLREVATSSAQPADGKGEGLACAHCRLLYPIVDGIPNLLIDEALPLPATPT